MIAYNSSVITLQYMDLKKHSILKETSLAMVLPYSPYLAPLIVNLSKFTIVSLKDKLPF